LSDILPPAPEPRPLPFRRPADYYAAPLSDVRPLFPRWVPLGCGAASLVMMIALFAAGAWAGGGKGGSIFATLFGTMQNEVHDMYTKDVTPAQKAAFDAEMNALKTNLGNGKVSIDRLQPLLHEMRDASMDSKITPAEVAQLTKAAHDVNAGVAGSRSLGVSQHPAETPRPRDSATPQ
jgi:hypothetical protein